MRKIYLLLFAENLPAGSYGYRPHTPAHIHAHPPSNSPATTCGTLPRKRAELFNASGPGRPRLGRVGAISFTSPLRGVALVHSDASQTVASLEGIARNMPEICVWQLAFDIQSCRASLTKRVTHTHPRTHTHRLTLKRIFCGSSIYL